MRVNLRCCERALQPIKTDRNKMMGKNYSYVSNMDKSFDLKYISSRNQVKREISNHHLGKVKENGLPVERNSYGQPKVDQNYSSILCSIKQK